MFAIAILGLTIQKDFNTKIKMFPRKATSTIFFFFFWPNPVHLVKLELAACSF